MDLKYLFGEMVAVLEDCEIELMVKTPVYDVAGNEMLGHIHDVLVKAKSAGVNPTERDTQ